MMQSGAALGVTAVGAAIVATRKTKAQKKSLKGLKASTQEVLFKGGAGSVDGEWAPDPSVAPSLLPLRPQPSPPLTLVCRHPSATGIRSDPRHCGPGTCRAFRGREQVPVRCVGARTVLNTSHTLLDADCFNLLLHTSLPCLIL